jgi:hypothetical protein
MKIGSCVRQEINSVLSRNTSHLYSSFATSSLSLQPIATMLHERKGSVTIGYWIYWTLAAYNTYDCNSQWRSRQFSQLQSIALSLPHTQPLCISQSLKFTTHTESSWSAVPPVLGYRLTTADVTLPGFSNCPRDTATANLDSLCTLSLL